MRLRRVNKSVTCPACGVVIA
ncbi:MAG: hypothetical protein QOK15_1156, partial [Nocardioidaceae bacterium]|nr:hypothetical protein [Nocardioidaceae bacterium]